MYNYYDMCLRAATEYRTTLKNIDSIVMLGQ